ncbi:MAG: hypothetical protein AAGI38_09090 [Bacteroidota bacterium]
MNPVLRQILAFLVLLFLQVVLFNELVLFGWVVPYPFLLFVCFLPLELPKPLLYVLAFGAGLMVDFFSETYLSGLQAFSALLTIGVREYVLTFLTPSSPGRNTGEISLENQNVLWYAAFLFPLIFCHHIAFYLLEAFGFRNFWYTLSKIFLGSGYTFAWCFVLTIIFYKKN